MMTKTARVAVLAAAMGIVGTLATTSCTSNSPTPSTAPAASKAPATPAPVASSAGSPAVSADGLQLVKNDAFARVYVRPGASLKPYTKFAILNCFVSFAPNWRED